MAIFFCDENLYRSNMYCIRNQTGIVRTIFGTEWNIKHKVPFLSEIIIIILHLYTQHQVIQHTLRENV